MSATKLLSAIIRKLMTIAPMTAAVAALPLLNGCGQKSSDVVRLNDFEKRVRSYYEAQNPEGKLLVKEVLPGETIEGFCVLSAYEDRVTPESDGVIAVNSFLESQSIVGTEEHWHLIIKTSKGLRLARFDTASTPLVSPRPTYEKKNCVIAKSIVFTKTVVMTGTTPLISSGSRAKIVINVQPGV